MSEGAAGNWRSSSSPPLRRTATHIFSRKTSDIVIIKCPNKWKPIWNGNGAVSEKNMAPVVFEAHAIHRRGSMLVLSDDLMWLSLKKIYRFPKMTIDPLLIFLALGFFFWSFQWAWGLLKKMEIHRKSTIGKICMTIIWSWLSIGFSVFSNLLIQDQRIKFVSREIHFMPGLIL